MSVNLKLMAEHFQGDSTRSGFAVIRFRVRNFCVEKKKKKKRNYVELGVGFSKNNNNNNNSNISCKDDFIQRNDHVRKDEQKRLKNLS